MFHRPRHLSANWCKALQCAAKSCWILRLSKLRRLASFIVVTLVAVGALAVVTHLGTIRSVQTQMSPAPVVSGRLEDTADLPWKAEPPLYYERPNRSGREVKALQERLSELGYLRGEIDGLFGLATLTALKRFQVDQMLVPNGEVDEQTALRLKDPRDTFAPPVHAPAAPIRVTADISQRSLSIELMNGDTYVFPCTVGSPRTPTPTGEWVITNKGRWFGQFGGYWLGFNIPFGQYGIHGTHQPWAIGSAASQGCIRLLNEHARIVYNWLPVGTRVVVKGLPSGRILKDGDRGTDVALVQKKLIEQGFLSGNPDGVYGPVTAAAAVKFQRKHGLYPSGRVGQQMYELLGIETDPEQGRPTPAAIIPSSGKEISQQ